MRAAKAAPAAKRRTDGGGVGAVRGRGRRTGALRLLVVPGVALLALGGCGGGVAVTGGLSGGGGGPEPASPVGRGTPPEPGRVVAEFLDAANRRDLAAMAARFGTAAGPIGERGSTLGCAVRRIGSWIGLGDRCLTATEVELRMDLMAAVLAHRAYRVGARTAVAGKGRPATRVEVEVDKIGRPGVLVPFVLIRSDDGRWLLEELGIERLVR